MAERKPFPGFTFLTYQVRCCTTRRGELGEAVRWFVGSLARSSVRPAAGPVFSWWAGDMLYGSVYYPARYAVPHNWYKQAWKRLDAVAPPPRLGIMSDK